MAARTALRSFRRHRREGDAETAQLRHLLVLLQRVGALLHGRLHERRFQVVGILASARLRLKAHMGLNRCSVRKQCRATS
jgi:hypothetical protein